MPFIARAVDQCPVCRSSAYRPARSRGPLTFGRCGQCGLAYVRPLVEDDDPSVAGSQSIRTLDEYTHNMLALHHGRAAAARPLAKARLDFYAQALGRRPQSLLDVGCGDGAFCQAYRELGVDWAGLDINPEVTAFTRAQGLPVVQGDFTRLPVERRFDVIFSSQVLEHCLNPHEFLDKARATLNPGGLLHLDVPNHNGLVPTVRKLNPRGAHYGFLQPPYHLLAYTRPVLRGLLERDGYEVLVCGAFDVCHPVFGQVQVSLRPEVRLLFRLTGWLGLGSLLVAAARPRG
jgi:SAM-dependent methyltransferase